MKNFFTRELTISLISTIILWFIIKELDIFNNYDVFERAFKDLSIYIGTALIGFLGIVLAGLGIFLSIFDKETRKEIRKRDKNNKFKEVFSSFYILALNTGILILLFFIIYLILHSEKLVIHSKLYISLILGVFFYFTYIIFYAVDLVRVSILGFDTVDTVETLKDQKGIVLGKLNQVRVEYLLRKYVEEKNIDKNSFISDITNFIDESEIENSEKEIIKTYMKDYYG